MPPNNPLPETCPKCGADQIMSHLDYGCGTHPWLWRGCEYRFDESLKCKDRQIAALTKERDRALELAALGKRTLNACSYPLLFPLDDIAMTCRTNSKRPRTEWCSFCVIEEALEDGDIKKFLDDVEAELASAKKLIEDYEQGIPHDALATMKAEIAALHEANRWIPVGERLPEVGEDVIVFTQGRRSIAMIDKDKKFIDLIGHYIEATHWRPLPEGPEGEGQ